jgi:hypothetical protein
MNKSDLKNLIKGILNETVITQRIAKKQKEIEKLLLGRTIKQIKLRGNAVELITDKGEIVYIEQGIAPNDWSNGSGVVIRSLTR